jgi:hypothetical protein
MPKYSVGEVLDIIKSLTPEERLSLQSDLNNMLSDMTEPVSAQTARQSQSFGSISLSGSGNIFGANQVGENANIDQARTQQITQSSELQEALNLLVQLSQAIANSKALNPIEKATFEVPVKTATAELQKPKPDQSIVDQAIAALKKGLSGIEELAEPVTRVAILVAKAWIML